MLSEEQKKVAIENIIDFFATQRDEKIGIIAAEDLLDFFLETFGDAIYNKGIDDSKKFLQEQINDLPINLELTLKKVK